MPTAAERSELDHLVLSVLTELGHGVTSSVLARQLDVPHRAVVGRLQALKRRGSVTFDRSGTYQSAAGVWSVSEEGAGDA